MPLLFSGNTLEAGFLKEKESKLNTIWWLILITALFGLALFSSTVFKSVKEVEGIDGELISHSKNRQYTILAAVIVFYTAFFVMLLYLLNNLA